MLMNNIYNPYKRRILQHVSYKTVEISIYISFLFQSYFLYISFYI